MLNAAIDVEIFFKVSYGSSYNKIIFAKSKVNESSWDTAKAYDICDRCKSELVSYITKFKNKGAD